jgi:hypothetical protein
MESILITLKDLSWIRIDVHGLFCKRVSRAGTDYGLMNWKGVCVSKVLEKYKEDEVAWIEYTKRTGEVVVIPKKKFST